MFYRLIIIWVIILITTTSAYAHLQNSFILIAPKEIEFNITTPNNLVTGYTPNGILEQIPQMSSYQYHTDIDNQGPLGEYDKFHTVSGEKVPNVLPSGIYKLTVYGTGVITTAEIYIRFGWTEAPLNRLEYSKTKLIYPNTIWVFEINVPALAPTPTQQDFPYKTTYTELILTKVSTPTDCIKDLTTAGQLGYIGSSEFVSEITKKINKIEEKRLKPAEKDDDNKLTPAQKAKKEYTELLGEITEKYNKPESDEFVKKEAYDVLKEDLEYIIRHL